MSHDILGLEDLKHRKALVNVLQALSSHKSSKSIVELSLSLLYHYQYSSLSDVLGEFRGTLTVSEAQKIFREMCMSYVGEEEMLPYTRLHSDVTGIEKPYSPTLEGRGFIHRNNNVIKGNKPITIGYNLSCVNLSLDDKWSLPLSKERVDLDQTASECLVDQLLRLLKEAPFADCELVVNCADSAYSHAGFVEPLYAQDQLVNILRLRHGSKVYTKSTKPYGGKGTPTVYGECYYLRQNDRIFKGTRKGKAYEKEQISISNLAPDERDQIASQTKKSMHTPALRNRSEHSEVVGR